MKHPTEYLVKLRKSIKEARIIVQRVPPAESLSTLHHLKVQAFVLLTHAAFEEYLETLCNAAALEARKKFSTKGEITHALVALIASKVLVDVQKKLNKSVTTDLVSNIEVFSAEAYNSFRRTIEANHGIKEENQKNLLLPVGVEPEKTDIALMNMLHAFGGDRGGIAHHFSAIRGELTLSSVSTNVAAILNGMATYDAAVCEALNLSMART